MSRALRATRAPGARVRRANGSVRVRSRHWRHHPGVLQELLDAQPLCWILGKQACDQLPRASRERCEPLGETGRILERVDVADCRVPRKRGLMASRLKLCSESCVVEPSSPQQRERHEQREQREQRE